MFTPPCGKIKDCISFAVFVTISAGFEVELVKSAEVRKDAFISFFGLVLEAILHCKDGI